MNNKEKIEAKIREAIGKPEGELTKADYDKVTSLDLRWNKLTNVQGLGKLTELTKLALGTNRLTKVQGLGKLTQLTWLGLDHNQLTEVKGLEKLTQLEELHLELNELTDVPKGLEKLPHLTKLFLQSNQLTDVKGLEKLTQLTVLGLSNNKLTDVKGLEKLTQLEELNLKHNQISEADIKALKAALPNCMIKEGAEVYFKGTFRVRIPNHFHPITGMEIPEEHIFTTPEMEFTYIPTNSETAWFAIYSSPSKERVAWNVERFFAWYADPNFTDAFKPLMQECCDHIAQTADMSKQVQLWVDCEPGCTLNGEEAWGFWDTYSKGDKLMEEWSSEDGLLTLGAGWQIL